MKRKIGYGIVQPGQSTGDGVDGVPIIKVNNIISGLKSVGGLDTTSHEISEKYSRTILRGGELIVSVVGTIGKTAIVPENFAGCNLVRAVALLDIEDKIISKWVKYYLDSPYGKDYIGQNLNTTVQPTLNIKSLTNMPVPFYDTEYMEKTTDLLSKIDDKIALNNKINENLEQQAQLLYKQYFPYSVNDKLPDGWHVGAVGEIVEIHDAKRIPLSGAERAKMKKKTYPYYGAAALMDYVDDYIFDGKYLLLGEDGTVVDNAGYPILQYVWGQFWVNNHAHVLTGKLGFNVESLYMLFKHTQVKSIVTGAVQPKISQANLRSIPVVIPPENLLIEYNSQIEPMFALFRANDKASKTLTVLRDTLLPKLMNGEIDITNIG